MKYLLKTIFLLILQRKPPIHKHFGGKAKFNYLVTLKLKQTQQ